MSSLVRLHKPHFFAPAILLMMFILWSPALMADNEITVKPGQTIMKIMQQQYSDQRSRWPLLMRKIIKMNASAFVNGDPRSLKPGAVIRLPELTATKKPAEKRIRAATVYKVLGSVSLFDDKKKIRKIKIGSHVFVGDQLLTSDTGVLRLKFIDGATIKLRCSSLLNIDEYKMRSRGSVSELSLLKGSLRAKSGRIGRRDNDRYVLKTPLGNITTGKAEYGVRVHQSQGCGQQADVDTDGLYLDVLNGKVSLLNAGHERVVASGDAAMIAQKEAAPASVQAFSGMVFGEKQIEQLPVAMPDSAQETRPAEKEAADIENNDIPVWWMLASLLILGVTF